MTIIIEEVFSIKNNITCCLYMFVGNGTDATPLWIKKNPTIVDILRSINDVERDEFRGKNAESLRKTIVADWVSITESWNAGRSNTDRINGVIANRGDGSESGKRRRSDEVSQKS